MSKQKSTFITRFWETHTSSQVKIRGEKLKQKNVETHSIDDKEGQ